MHKHIKIRLSLPPPPSSVINPNTCQDICLKNTDSSGFIDDSLTRDGKFSSGLQWHNKMYFNFEDIPAASCATITCILQICTFCSKEGPYPPNLPGLSFHYQYYYHYFHNPLRHHHRDMQQHRVPFDPNPARDISESPQHH
mmetsp:Transcript_15868/g.23865  ORF Transcript_15868/g.23865 Transcript_15868/m.23865 type:complete len:141 (+) Transcript_15868:518-940(+)